MITCLSELNEMISSRQKDANLSNLLPVNLRVDGRNVLITGGGKRALREVIRFVDYNAKVEAIAPIFASEIEELSIAHSNRLTLTKREMNARDYERIMSGSFFVVVAASTDLEENAKLLQVAQQARVLSVSDDFNANCDMVFGQSVKRGHLKFAVSTDGVSHALERALIGRLEGVLVNDIDRYVLFLNALADKLKRTAQDNSFTDEQKLAFVRQLAESEDIYRAVCRGNFDEARKLTEQILNGTHQEESPIY